MARRTGAARALPIYAGAVLLVAGLTGLAQVPPGAGKNTPKDAKTTAVPQQTEDKSRQVVPITTVDGVDLEGTFFRGRFGRDTPCVLMIHNWGSDRSRGDWTGLAVALQTKGYAVLTFDLRGHGRSTTISDPAKFWAVPMNKTHIRGANVKKTTINYNEFRPTYLPMMVNDVLAARRFLEGKNDFGEVNTNSIVVLGAQAGASLGMLFTAEEFDRSYTVGFVPLQSNGTRHLAGDDLAAGVWLSLTLRPENVSFNADGWIRNHPQIRDKVPMQFIYGERDTRARQDAESVLRALSPSGREKHKFDTKVEIKGTDLAGQALLGQPALGVNAMIVDYIDKVLAERKAVPWSKVDVETNKILLVNLMPYGFRGPQ